MKFLQVQEENQTKCGEEEVEQAEKQILKNKSIKGQIEKSKNVLIKAAHFALGSNLIFIL